MSLIFTSSLILYVASDRESYKFQPPISPILQESAKIFIFQRRFHTLVSTRALRAEHPPDGLNGKFDWGEKRFFANIRELFGDLNRRWLVGPVF